METLQLIIFTFYSLKYYQKIIGWQASRKALNQPLLRIIVCSNSAVYFTSITHKHVSLQLTEFSLLCHLHPFLVIFSAIYRKKQDRLQSFNYWWQSLQTMAVFNQQAVLWRHWLQARPGKGQHRFLPACADGVVSVTRLVSCSVWYMFSTGTVGRHTERKEQAELNRIRLAKEPNGTSRAEEVTVVQLQFREFPEGTYI